MSLQELHKYKRQIVLANFLSSMASCADLLDYVWYVMHRHKTTKLSTNRNEAFETISGHLKHKNYADAIVVIEAESTPNAWLEYWKYANHNAHILAGLMVGVQKDKLPVHIASLHQQFTTFADAHPNITIAAIKIWENNQSDQPRKKFNILGVDYVRMLEIK